MEHTGDNAKRRKRSRPDRLEIHYKKSDPHLGWFYRPHTISILVACVIVLVYVAFQTDSPSDKPSSSPILFGLGAMSLVFLVFSMVQMRDGLFCRPHPVFWRIVMGMAVLYLCLLVFVLFQTADYAREMLSYLDPQLGKPLPERSYGEDCRFYTPEHPESLFYNFRETLFDEFILAHFFGWWLKAMMFRDVWFCWVTSILFELLEYTFEHYLPNFIECWWDHLILDVLVCNAAGIYLGIKTCRFLEVKEYNWAGTEGAVAPTRKGKMVLALRKNVPIERFDWDVLSSGKRFFAVCLLIALIEVVELNAFFLKFVLWIPPPHYLNILRLVLWFLMGMPALRECYQFATDPTCKRLGTMAWLSSAILSLEVLISVKFGKGMFPNPWPFPVVAAWSGALCIFFLWCVFYWGYYIRRKGKQPLVMPTPTDSNNKKKKKKKNK